LAGRPLIQSPPKSPVFTLSLETRMTTTAEFLGLRLPPIAIGYFDQPQPGLVPWQAGAVPAGCSFWPEAATRSFYTAQADHYNCAIGCHTHNIPLPAERQPELMQTIEFMVACKYLAMAEVPGIPTLPRSPRYVAYGPAADPGFPPDAILLMVQPAQAMIVYEAAVKAGATAGGLVNSLGRPACAILPLSLKTGQASLSFGCQGNRTFTGLADDEAYVCVPGARWEAVAAHLAEAAEANAKMAAYYFGKKEALAKARSN
jgi:uncharacterized protein (DUF169 family)